MIIIVMGVTGCGKTTVGRRLAERFGLEFIEGDQLHPAANVRKMAAGSPLDDADREPWLEAIADLVRRYDAAGRSAVITCSALKESYRRTLRAGDVRFVYLKVSPDLARARLLARPDHFMPSTLVDSQFAALEEPKDALVINASLDLETIVAAIGHSLGLDPPRNE